VTRKLAYIVAVTLSVVSLAADSPNFVVILTDDQSWVGTSVQIDPDDSRTVSDYYRTPNIRRLAEQGMRFTAGYSPAPYCCPTRRSLLIGQTPARHIYHKDRENWTATYRKQLTIPQVLKQADERYHTAHFGKWDMRNDRVTPEEMGYDVSDGYTDNGTGGGRGSGGPAAKDDPKLIFGITDRTCTFIEESKKAGRPFYVQVSHYAVHLAIYYRQKTLDDAKRWKKGDKHTMPEFAAMTGDLDTSVGILLDKIKALGLDDTTYVFFMSDNGGRKDMPGQTGATLARNFPLREGKGSMYEGGIRVPFFVRGPKIAVNSVSDVRVTGLDILPTVAEMAGFDGAMPEQVDGGSMASVLFNKGQGEVQRRNPFLIFHHAVDRSPQTALIERHFKLIKSGKEGELELFNLLRDPEEKRNLIDKMPGKSERMHDVMTTFLADVGAETQRTEKKEKKKR
jgi:arylsulfatase A-like enzyme